MDFDFKPITLLKGHHDDTARTGHGCFMDVVSYLNGDVIITDGSPCVCVCVRSLAVALNDSLPLSLRNQFLRPFILRALGSATHDLGVLSKRYESLRECTIALLALIGSTRDTGYFYALNFGLESPGDLLNRALEPISCTLELRRSTTSMALAVEKILEYPVIPSTFKDAAMHICLHYLDEVLPPLEQLPPPTVDVQSRYQALVDMARAGVKPVPWPKPMTA